MEWSWQELTLNMFQIKKWPFVHYSEQLLLNCRESWFPTSSVWQPFFHFAWNTGVKTEYVCCKGVLKRVNCSRNISSIHGGTWSAGANGEVLLQRKMDNLISAAKAGVWKQIPQTRLWCWLILLFHLAFCPMWHLVLVLFFFAAHISLAGGNIGGIKCHLLLGILSCYKRKQSGQGNSMSQVVTGTETRSNAEWFCHNPWCFYSMQNFLRQWTERCWPAGITDS